jgi:predicted nucleotidyltransferase
VFESLLALLARELDRAGIAYMVIGGQAVQFYGEARMTQDIDLTLGIGIEGLDLVLGVCRACGLELGTDMPEEFVRDTLVLPAIEEKTDIHVDFIFSLTGYEPQAIERGRLVELGGTKVRFAALEDLIIHKLVAGRPRDIEDARIILAKNPGFDRAYTELWLRRFDQTLAQDISSILRRLLQV